MGRRNNNISKQGIEDVYRKMISRFDNEGRDSSMLRSRLGQLQLKSKKKDRLIVAEALLRDVLKEVGDFQDKYGISPESYYTIKEFLDGD